MRILILALAFALAAGPAWARAKSEHAASPWSASEGAFWADPCGVSHNPHQSQGMLSVSLRCHHLLAAWRASPDDEALHERCDRIAEALTDRRCATPSA